VVAIWIYIYSPAREEDWLVRGHNLVMEAVGSRGKGSLAAPVTSRGTAGAANGRAGEQYQVKARY